MFELFGKKPDHPLFSLAEAKQQLGELPRDDARKSLEEITFWLDSIKSAAGFNPALRAEIIMLLDESGQTLQTKLLNQYLDAPNLRNFQGTHLWQGIHDFTQALADAYTASIREYQQAEKKPLELKEQIPLICTRQLQAASTQMKLEMMRYIEIAPSVWQRMWFCYQFAEIEQCVDSLVFAYHEQVAQTNPKRELLRALALYISSPGTLAADQIEVGYRVAGRLANLFDLKKVADTGCPYHFDLSTNAPPRKTDSGPGASTNIRFFGTVSALPELKKIIDKVENDRMLKEQRVGSEFTPAGKLTVLKHLMKYWGQELPHRALERRNIRATIEVAHGFRVISQLVAHLDSGDIPELSIGTSKERSKVDLDIVGDTEYTTEVWDISDMSTGGIRAILTGNLGTWIKIGNLCALKPQKGQRWWIGTIRRLHTDTEKKIHVGIELLAKSPASVNLRALGKGADKAFNWDTDSGLFAYEYLPVILLPDANGSFFNATMLIESGRFALNDIYQAIMGENFRDLKLTKLLAEGEDYDHANFEWMLQGADASKK